MYFGTSTPSCRIRWMCTVLLPLHLAFLLNYFPLASAFLRTIDCGTVRNTPQLEDEGIWQQYVRTSVQFKFFVKDMMGMLQDSFYPITAVLEGPEYYQATVFQTGTGEYTIEFVDPQFEGDYQMHVMVGGREMYQWLVQLREKKSQRTHLMYLAGGTVQFFIDGPGLGGGEAKKPVYININVRDLQGQPTDVDILNFQVFVGVALHQFKAKLEHVQTGLYRAHFTVERQGMTPIDVRYCGNSISRPPITVMFW